MALSTTSTRIANRALAAIGQTTQLTDVETDENNAARQVRLVYDDCLDDVLTAVPWNFNSRRASLPQADTTPLFDFAYQYPLPADCLKVRELYDNRYSSAYVTTGVPRTYDDGRDRWRVETIGDTDAEYRKVLVCDLGPPCSIVYSWRVTALQRWSSPARSALIALLAANIAMPIAQKPKLSESLMNQYKAIIAQAASIDAQEASETTLDEGDWVRARDSY